MHATGEDPPHYSASRLLIIYLTLFLLRCLDESPAVVETRFVKVQFLLIFPPIIFTISASDDKSEKTKRQQLQRQCEQSALRSWGSHSMPRMSPDTQHPCRGRRRQAVVLRQTARTLMSHRGPGEEERRQ